MKILFLHGWHSIPGGAKPTHLNNHGHEVINPALDDDDFTAAVATAQAEFDQHQPQVVVGSSRGGAVAMNINSGSAKLVLLCPAWKNWGTVNSVTPDTVILHSRGDEVIRLLTPRLAGTVGFAFGFYRGRPGTTESHAESERILRLLPSPWYVTTIVRRMIVRTTKRSASRHGREAR